MKKADVTIIGAGIVGLATAYTIHQKRPDLSISIIEKEGDVAQHQTGHNSGVIHTGIYYKPGSLKATNCIRGKALLLDFCTRENVSYKKIPKLIVSTSDQELSRMQALYERGKANGLSHLRVIDKEEAQEREPHINVKQAILNEECHIVSYTEVSKAIKQQLLKNGVSFYFNEAATKITELDDHSFIEGSTFVHETKYLINCAGLFSDQVAQMTQNLISDQIIPFRGEYYFLRDELKDKVQSLIYPVPNPQLPFLGVHITPMIDGRIEAGPNAVLAFAREGYTKTKINTSELMQTLLFPGFWKVAKNHLTTGIYEMYRSFSKKAFLKSLQELMPSLSLDDISPGGAGVRAQLVRRDGSLCDDFSLIQNKSMMHVLNAPSPAATSSFAIGEHIANTMFPA